MARIRNLNVPFDEYGVRPGNVRSKAIYKALSSAPFSYVEDKPRKVNEMARRGRKARARTQDNLTEAQRRRVGMAMGNFFNARGRAPRGSRVAPTTVVVAAPQAAPARRTRRKRGNVITRTVNVVRTKTRNVGRRIMARGRKGSKSSGMTYGQVTGNLPIQVAQTVAEIALATVSVGADVYTASTASKADDLAFPVVKYAAGTVGRWLSQKYLATKHPGLAATLSAGMSAMNGDQVGTALRARLGDFLRPSSPPASPPSGPPRG